MMASMVATMDKNVTFGINGIIGILVIVGKWLILEKMGEDGWKALIPIYSEYLIFKHVWSTEAFMADLVTAIISGLAVGIGAAGEKFLNPLTILLIVMFGMAFAIANFVINIKCCKRLATAFGHGTGYALGLMFLTPIFLSILGLSRNETYVGEHPQY